MKSLKFHIHDFGDPAVGIPGIDEEVEIKLTFGDWGTEFDSLGKREVIEWWKDKLREYFEVKTVMTEEEYKQHVNKKFDWETNNG